MTNTTIPDKNAINELYAFSIDTLRDNNYIFDTEANGFYNLVNFDLDVGVNKKTIQVSRPFTHESNYIFAISDIPDISVSLELYYHRTGTDIPIEIEVININ